MCQIRKIVIVTACMRDDGMPTFVLNEVAVTQDQIENGVHYYLAEGELLEAGYEEPFVHFDENEAPPFLHPAVRQHLGLPLVVAEPATVPITEESECLA